MSGGTWWEGLMNVLIVSEERIRWWGSSGEKLGREDKGCVKSGF
jgi:hypothetical protein